MAWTEIVIYKLLIKSCEYLLNEVHIGCLYKKYKISFGHIIEKTLMKLFTWPLIEIKFYLFFSTNE